MNPPHPIYEECLQLAASAGGPMMADLAGHARRALARRDDGRSPDVTLALGLLDRHEPALRSALPKVLSDAFTRGQPPAADADSLTLMDDTQLRESMEAARLRKAVALRLDAALAELDALVCAARGLDTVRPAGNPLRPEVFLGALRDAVAQAGVAPQVQSLWLAPMGGALGDALLPLYADLAALLKAQDLGQPGGEPAPAQAPPPAAEALPPSAPVQHEPRPAPAIAPARRKLLLVDDDKAVVSYLAVKLGKHFDIVSTTQPASAPLLARTERPDVILCDIDMPGMSGGEVAAALAADPRTAAIPLIYLTALATPEEIADLQGMVSGRPAVSKKARLAELLVHIESVSH